MHFVCKLFTSGFILVIKLSTEYHFKDNKRKSISSINLRLPACMQWNSFNKQSMNIRQEAAREVHVQPHLRISDSVHTFSSYQLYSFLFVICFFRLPVQPFS